MKLFSTLLLSILLWYSCKGQATLPQQSVIVKPINANENNAILCRLQDKAGNIWCATDWGVYRYNGKWFTHFSTKDGLPYDRVNCIVEDKNGNIWFGMIGGICSYNGKNFKYFPIQQYTGFFIADRIATAQSTKETQVRSMMVDRNGRIWIGTNNDGVYCFDGTAFSHFLHNDGVVNKEHLRLIEVTNMIEDRKGVIWFTTWFEGVCKYDGKSIASIKPKGKVWFASIMEDRNGNLWFGTRDYGAYRFDGTVFTSFDVPIFNSCCITSMVEDKAGNIWFGAEAGDMTMRETSGGVWLYDGKKFKNFIQKDGLENCSVYSVLADDKGYIWAGTRNNSLYRYDGKVFSKFAQ